MPFTTSITLNYRQPLHSINHFLKGLFVSALAAFVFISCGTKEKEAVSQVDTVDANRVVINEIIHDTLSAAQMERIKRIHTVFLEVEPVSFEETVSDFKRDQNPDREIEIWLAMAAAYEQYVTKHPSMSLELKQEVYKVVLMRSMANEAETRANVETQLLSDKDITEIMGYYRMEAKPMLLIKDEEGHEHEYGH